MCQPHPMKTTKGLQSHVLNSRGVPAAPTFEGHNASLLHIRHLHCSSGLRVALSYPCARGFGRPPVNHAEQHCKCEEIRNEIRNVPNMQQFVIWSTASKSLH